MINKKQITIAEAVAFRNKYRDEGKRVAALSGSFDILHGGHVVYLEDARAQADVLFVFLNTDESVRLYKGSSRPYMPEGERSLLLSVTSLVDHIVLFDELTPIHVLAELQPDVYVNGPDWGKNCIERETVESYGGMLYIHNPPQKFSSSAIIDKIIASEKENVCKAVFLDRDGTIIDNKEGYLSNPQDIELMPDAADSLARLQAAGYELIVVTNQSGIGRGYFPEKNVQLVHDFIRDALQKKNVTINEFYYCPHSPDEGCDCRKPEPGMLLRAAKERRIVLNASWMVGDRCSDVAAGRYANVRTIRLTHEDTACTLEANHTAKTLTEAADLILGKR